MMSHRSLTLGSYAFLFALVATSTAAGQSVLFRRSDANADGKTDIGDAVYTLSYLFTGGPAPPCLRAADTNDDAELDVSDPVFTLGFLFLGRSRPPSPGLSCGYDSTADRLGCFQYGTCRQPVRPFEVVDGLAVIEEDIVIGRVEDIPLQIDLRDEAGGGGGWTVREAARWPEGVVPFTIDPALPAPNRVTMAMQTWESNAGVQFTPRTTEVDFVTFRRSTNASICGLSPVGRKGGQQFVDLVDGCGVGTALHEIGHALGLWHEQNRADRDGHIKVNYENIDPAFAYNFDIEDGLPCTRYDHGSIMHYGAMAFSTNGLVTIETIPPGIPIGQRTALSAGDIAAVARLYSLDAVLNVSGRLTLLRVHEIGGGYGGKDARIDGEVVIKLDSQPDEAYGFQLRSDSREATHRGMLNLVRDSFVRNRVVSVDFVRTDCLTGRVMRVVNVP